MSMAHLSPGCGSSEAPLGKDTKLTSLSQDLFLVLVGYQPEVSSVPWHMTSLNGCLLHKIQQVWGSVEFASKMEITVLFNIITEVTSIAFVVFYCLETSCRSCPHSKGNGLHMGMNVRRQRWFGTILEPVSHCLPLQIPSPYLQGAAPVTYSLWTHPDILCTCVKSPRPLQKTIKNYNVVFTVLSTQIFSFNNVCLET